MSEPLFSPLAVADLEGILEYIGRDKPSAAIAFVEMLKESAAPWHGIPCWERRGKT